MPEEYFGGGLNTEDRISRTYNRHPTQTDPPVQNPHPKAGRDRHAGIQWGGARLDHHGMYAHCPSPRVHVHPAPSHSTNVIQRLTGENLRLRETRVTCTVALRRCILHAAAYPASYESLGAGHGHKRPQIREVRWSCARGLTGDKGLAPKRWGGCSGEGQGLQPTPWWPCHTHLRLCHRRLQYSKSSFVTTNSKTS